MLKAYGRTVTIRRVSPEEPDPITDLPAEASGATQQVSAVMKAPSTMTEQSYASQFAAGTMVRSRTQSVTFAAVDLSGQPTVPPQEGDELVVDGVVWRFMGVSVAEPDGTPIVFTGTVKR